jgi:hypothetical protein
MQSTTPRRRRHCRPISRPILGSSVCRPRMWSGTQRAEVDTHAKVQYLHIGVSLKFSGTECARTLRTARTGGLELAEGDAVFGKGRSEIRSAQEYSYAFVPRRLSMCSERLERASSVWARGITTPLLEIEVAPTQDSDFPADVAGKSTRRRRRPCLAAGDEVPLWSK